MNLHTYTHKLIIVVFVWIVNISCIFLIIMLHYNVSLDILTMLRVLYSRTCPIPFGTKFKTVILPSEHHDAQTRVEVPLVHLFLLLTSHARIFCIYSSLASMEYERNEITLTFEW